MKTLLCWKEKKKGENTMYYFERQIMTFDGLKYQVIRMKHRLFKDQWKDRCKVYLIKEGK